MADIEGALVFEFSAVDGLTARAVHAREVATLAHEARYDPVKNAALVVQWSATLPNALFTCTERAEIFSSLRYASHAAKQIKLEPARLLAANLNVEKNL